MHSPFPQIGRDARRLTEILAVLGKYGLADLLGGLPFEWLQGHLLSFDGERLGQLSRDARIRLAMTELGATFIKLGQALSTRVDLIGPELAEELGKLLSNTSPDPPAVVRAVIAAELGQAIEELFAEFDDRAMASASIGQVHRARLRDGQAVVVKVQRQGIEEKIASDLNIMDFLAATLQKHVARSRNYQPIAVAHEFRRTIERELDFSCERRNLEEFARNFGDDGTVHFPIAFPDRCSRRVLTMELLTGISFENSEGLRQAEADLNEIAWHGANAYLEMIFRDGFYHADPHPGNLMLLAQGVIGIIDGGMIGRIDDSLREDIESMIEAVVQKNAQAATDAVLRLASIAPDIDLNMLRSDINEFIQDYATRSIGDINLSAALNEITGVIRRYHIILPTSCTLLIKTVIMLEGTSRRLRPTFNLAEMIKPYEEKSVYRRLSLSRLWARLSRSYHDWDRFLNALPRDLREILQRLRSGHYEVQHRHHGLESTVNRLVAGLLTAALFVGSAQLWSSNVPPLVLGISLPGVLGYSLALLLGFRLFRAIKRSEDKSEKP